jgi:hypothetical protein
MLDRSATFGLTMCLAVGWSLSSADSVSAIDPAKKTIRAQLQAARKAEAAKQAQAAKTNKPSLSKNSAATTVKAATAPAKSATVIAKKAPALPKKLEAPALARRMDEHIQTELLANDVHPSPAADDAEFIRRVYLDLTGAIPPVEKVVAFLDDPAPDKRSRVVDEILDSPAYGRRQADIWQSLLLPKNSDNRRLQATPLVTWLEERFNSNKPWNQLVSDLLTASGPQDENGATTFFIANNTPDKLTDQTTKLFLGIQLQCAQCHNHPFTTWKQDDYWGMAAFFMKVRASGNPNQAARDGKSIEIKEVASNNRPRRQQLPESAKILPAKFFLAEQPKLDTNDPYRPALAKWLTSTSNPYFAKATVNRVWAQLFGRGLVHPIDDMHEGNPATHPKLLDELAGQFAASGFDLKHLIRAICATDAYHRTSRPYGGNEADEVLISHMAVKPLTPEQLFDSLTPLIGQPRADMRPARMAAAQANRPFAPSPRANFINSFNLEDGADSTEYQAGIPQVLRLMNAGQFNPANAAILRDVLRSTSNKPAVAEKLCLAVLSRRPTPAESEKWTAHLAKETDQKKAAADLLWALLNSSEFALNH